jgi:hypothetical protein
VKKEFFSLKSNSHQVELVVQPGPGLADRRGVREHANGTLQLGQIASGHNRWRLVVYADFEAGRAPVNELDGPFRLYVGNCRVHLFWNHIAAKQQATGLNFFHFRKLENGNIMREKEPCISRFWDRISPFDVPARSTAL